MKNILLLLTIILSGLFVLNCNKEPTENTQTDKHDMKQKNDSLNQIDAAKLVKDGTYVCPIHPLKQSNEQIKCPKCKLLMISKNENNRWVLEMRSEMKDRFKENKNAAEVQVNISVINSDDCGQFINDRIKGEPGVLETHINAINRVAYVYVDKNRINKDRIVKIITDSGFDANDSKANPEAINKLFIECRPLQ